MDEPLSRTQISLVALVQGQHASEVIKTSKPFCPKCGKKRGVTIQREGFPVGVTVISGGKTSKECKTQYNYYLCCVKCQHRWQLIDMGVWNP